MKLSELKNLLKPMIKEMVRETLLEEVISGGVISHIISESLKATAKHSLMEVKQEQSILKEEKLIDLQKQEQIKKTMLSKIGNESYSDLESKFSVKKEDPKIDQMKQKINEQLGLGGSGVFEGTTSLDEVEDNHNSGVDLRIFGNFNNPEKIKQGYSNLFKKG